MTLEKSLQLIFRNAEGALFTISLSFPREDLTVTEVTAVMDNLLGKNVFESTGGTLIEKVRARLVSREVVDIVSFV